MNPIDYAIYVLANKTNATSHTESGSLWCPRGVIVKAMDCGIVVSEFVLQSLYYVHFRTNTLGKGMKPLILLAMGEIVSLLFF